MNTHRATITETQHFNVVARQMLSGGRSGVYAKPSETQAKAMKRILAASRRVAADKAPSFPTFRAGMSTADYVAQYHAMNSGRCLKTDGFFGELNTEPAALYEGGSFDFAPIMETVPDDEAETFDFCGSYSEHVAHCNMVGLRPMSLQTWIARNSEPTEQLPAPPAEIIIPWIAEPAEVCEPVPSEPAEVSAPTEQPADPGAAADWWMPRPSVYRTHIKTAKLANTLFPIGTWNDGTAPWFLRDKREKTRPDVRAMRDAIAAAVRQARKPAPVTPPPTFARAPETYQYLPTFAKLAIERLDADSDLRTPAMLDQLLNAYAGTYGQHCDDYTRESAHYRATRRFWNFKPDGTHPGDDAPKDHPRADAHPAAAAESRPANEVSAAGRAAPAAVFMGGASSAGLPTPTPLRQGNSERRTDPVSAGQFGPVPDDEARERLTAAGYRLESRGILPYFKPDGSTVRLQTYRLAHPGDGRCGLRIDGVTFPLCRDSLERHEKAARDAAAGSRAANLAELLSGRRLAA